MEEYYWILTASIFLADLAIRACLPLRVILRKREARIAFIARLKENCPLLGPLSEPLPCHSPCRQRSCW